MYGKIKDYLQNELETIEKNGIFKKERIITSPQGPEITISTGETVLNFCANNYLGLADVCQVRTSFCVDAEQKVDTRTLKLIASEKILQLSSWCRKGLSGPVGDFANTQALCIPLRKEEFDRRGRHGAL